jgi:hypothetical protein
MVVIKWVRESERERVQEKTVGKGRREKRSADGGVKRGDK